MQLVAVGLSHRAAPVEVRERLALQNHQIHQLLNQFQEQGLVEEAVLLSTCNRVELYAVPSRKVEQNTLIRWLARRGGIQPELFYQYKQKDALEHLFRVSSSLDSMVIGEPQIVAQVRNSYRLAVEAKSAGPLLQRVLDQALRVAKRVRTETNIAREAVSIGRAGVEIARQVHGDLSGKSALLIGAGAHGKLIARHLFSHGIAELVIANRTFSNAVEMATIFSGSAIHMDEIHRYLERVDIVIACVGAGEILIDRKSLIQIRRQRRYRPLVLIDLSVPRVIDSSIHDLDGVFHFDVDDMAQLTERGRISRETAAMQAEKIIDDEVQRCWGLIVGERYNTQIGQIARSADAIRRKEVERTTRSLQNLSDEERQIIEAMSRSIVKKILHQPMSVARSLAQQGDGVALDVLLKTMCRTTEDDSS